MKPSKFVVTGATGHLGRHVVEALGGLGEVVALSRSGAMPRAPFGAKAAATCRSLKWDAGDDASVAALRSELGPHVALIHLAAWHPPSTARTTPEDRAKLLEFNVQGTLRALDAARRLEAGPGAACVVYASTFEVYGIPEHSGAVVESDRLNPITDYGATKLAGEDHLLAFSYEEQTRVAALRLPAIYGAGELTERALPNFLRCVARGERPRIVGSGSDLRDQVHVRDAATAVVQCALGAATGIVNIADGEPHSILQLAETAMAVAGLSGRPERLPAERPAYDFHMSIERARRELPFVPRVALADGMREQLDWLRTAHS